MATQSVTERCVQAFNVIVVIMAFVFASAMIHWLLSYSYYHFCIGSTIQDAIMSVFGTGSVGCQLLFRGMRISHYEYMRHVVKLFNIL